MGRWVLLLGGLLVWAAHFFLLYAFASLFPGTRLARILTFVATIPALAAVSWLLWTAAARTASGQDELDRWILNVGAVGAAISLVAIVWQALPALIV